MIGAVPAQAFAVLAQAGRMLLAPPIPDPDPMPLPGPVWLFKGLLLFTFLLHAVPMNLVLGGGIVLFRSHLGARRGGPTAAYHRRLIEEVGRRLPVAVAFAITLGIAPLLFVQVLYGQLYFTSSVLMAWPWLALIGLLMLGYYGAYWHAGRQHGPGGRGAWVALGVAAVFTAVAFLFTNNLSLMQNPVAWRTLYLGAPQGTTVYALHDPSVIPRFLHFLLAALAFTGLAVAGLGVALRRQDAPFAAWACRQGAHWFSGPTAAQAIVGPWFLLEQPARVRAAFLGASAPDAALLGAAILLALVALALVGGGEGITPARFAAAAGSLGGTIALMIVIRHRVRTLWLAPVFDVDRLPTSPQWGAMLLFAALLLAGLALVAWMLGQYFGVRSKDR